MMMKMVGKLQKKILFKLNFLILIFLEIADRRRRQRRRLDINRENLNNVDIISLSTETLSSEFSDQFDSSNENIANSDEEYADNNASNDGSNDSSWQTEDELEEFH